LSGNPAPAVADNTWETSRVAVTVAVNSSVGSGSDFLGGFTTRSDSRANFTIGATWHPATRRGVSLFTGFAERGSMRGQQRWVIVATVATIVVLTGCSGDRVDSQPSTEGTPTVRETQPPAAGTAILRTQKERQLIRLMNDLGAHHAGVMEHGYGVDAFVGGTFRSGDRSILVHTYDPDVGTTPGRVIDRIRVLEVPVNLVYNLSFGLLARFECRSLGYDISSHPDDQYPSHDRRGALQFSRAILMRQGCGSPPTVPAHQRIRWARPGTVESRLACVGKHRLLLNVLSRRWSSLRSLAIDLTSVPADSSAVVLSHSRHDAVVLRVDATGRVQERIKATLVGSNWVESESTGCV